MQQEGEIEYGSPLCECADIATRCENEDLVSIEIELEGVQEGDSIRVGVGEYIFDFAQPFIQFVLALSARFVAPMGSQSVFCQFVHAVGAYLYLDPLSVLPHHGHMQCLITIGFGGGNPVADTFGVWTINLGDGGIDHPALVFLGELRVGFEHDTCSE